MSRQLNVHLVNRLVRKKMCGMLNDSMAGAFDSYKEVGLGP